MKIANVVRRFAFEEWGGTETVVWNTAKCLRGFGVTPEILCTRALSSCSAEEVDGITIRRFPYFYPNFPLSAAKIRQLDKKGGNPFSFQLYYDLLQGGFSLIHSHTMARLAGMAAKAARQKNIPLVISFHGGCYDVPPAELEEMLRPVRHTLNYGKGLDLLFGNISALDAADGIICVGLNEYEIAREKFPDKLVTYLPNGVSPEKFIQPAAINFRGKYGIADNIPLLLCVSRIDYQKNQKILVNLAEQIRQAGENAHIVIIGPPTAEQYYRELREQIELAGLTSRFTIIPGLPSESPELLSAYQAADLFILPSLHEPFGIVVLEAWAAGLPVIAANVGGLGRLVEDGKTGLLFDPKSAAALFAAWRRWLDNPALAADLRQNGKNIVTEKYSWQTVTGELLDFYQKVIEFHAGKK